jgi:putative redox protein
METVRTTYVSNLRTEATHVQSGNSIITDAPVDNQGKGEYFSPTDMVAAALASCAMTIMGIAARDNGFSIDGAKASTTKIMASDPRRISEIQIEYNFEGIDLNQDQRKIIEDVSLTCPVCLSLNSNLKRTITFCY